MKLNDPKKNRATSDKWRNIQSNGNDASAGVNYNGVNGISNAATTGSSATAATDGIDGLRWEEDFQRGRGLDYQPWGTFYLKTESLIAADGTTNYARNGQNVDAADSSNALGGNAFGVEDVRQSNARREGVTRDMCEECSVLCNRYGVGSK